MDSKTSLQVWGSFADLTLAWVQAFHFDKDRENRDDYAVLRAILEKGKLVLTCEDIIELKIISAKSRLNDCLFNLQKSGILILNNGPLENVKTLKHYHFIKQGQNITSFQINPRVVYYLRTTLESQIEPKLKQEEVKLTHENHSEYLECSECKERYSREKHFLLGLNKCTKFSCKGQVLRPPNIEITIQMKRRVEGMRNVLNKLKELLDKCDEDKFPNSESFDYDQNQQLKTENSLYLLKKQLSEEFDKSEDLRKVKDFIVSHRKQYFIEPFQMQIEGYLRKKIKLLESKNNLIQDHKVN